MEKGAPETWKRGKEWKKLKDSQATRPCSTYFQL